MVRYGVSAVLFFMNHRERPPKLSRQAKVTAHPTIGLFSNYIREGAQIGLGKEKRETRRYALLGKTSRISIF
jgi:hypothetical protein